MSETRADTRTTPPLIEFRDLTKKFGAVTANSKITFSVAPQTIHAIVGENGAGKSTAMNILFGLYQADEGTLFLRGQRVDFKSPIDAMKAGIGMVHQHFMLAEPFTALDNLLLHTTKKSFFLKRDAQLSHLKELALSFGFEVDLTKTISQLPVGLQQRVEILKALAQDSEVIILDEPTAVLTPQEVDALFVTLQRLKSLGKTILIITHKLKEVMGLADKVTVFRQGQVVAERLTSKTTATELAELMIGHKLPETHERRTTIGIEQILQVNELNATLDSDHLHDVSFSVRSGEILGVAGVEGNGQNILIRGLLDPASFEKKLLSGAIILNGKNILTYSASKIRELGLAAFPEDRLRYGVLAHRPLYENFLLGSQRSRKYTWGPFLKLKKLLVDTASALQTYDVRPRSVTHLLDQLSGGNQQKLVVARELSNNPSFILAAQPTRGVDIGAIGFIHSQLREMRDRKAGILLVSSELDELLTLSDRIVVLFKGKIVASFQRAEFDASQIGAAMGGNFS